MSKYLVFTEKFSGKAQFRATSGSKNDPQEAAAHCQTIYLICIFHRNFLQAWAFIMWEIRFYLESKDKEDRRRWECRKVDYPWGSKLCQLSDGSSWEEEEPEGDINQEMLKTLIHMETNGREDSGIQGSKQLCWHTFPQAMGSNLQA